MCGGIVIIYQFALCAYAGGGEEARMPPLHNAVSGLHFIFDLVPPEHVCGSPLSDLSPCSPFFRPYYHCYYHCVFLRKRTVLEATIVHRTNAPFRNA